MPLRRVPLFDLYVLGRTKALHYYSTHYLQSCLSVGFYGHDVTKHKATIWDSGDEKFSTTTRATTAKAVGAVIANPKESANQFLYVSSFEITMNEFVASLKKATGVDDWDIEHVKGDEQMEQG